MHNKNIFDSINLTVCTYDLSNKIAYIHYKMLIDSGKTDEANEYLEKHKTKKLSFIINPSDRAVDFVSKYKNILIEQAVDEDKIKTMQSNMLEVSIMAEIYLEMRSKYLGRGSNVKRDKLAIQFFSYAFRYLGLSPRDPSDVATIEILTNIDIFTGSIIKVSKRDKRRKLRPNRKRCYIKHRTIRS